MNMDFSKFYGYLMEAKPSGTEGKTFKELATTPWYYIPFATDGSDFGPRGKGTGKFKLLIRESGESWDVFMFSKTSTATTAARSSADIKKAAEDLKRRQNRSDATQVEGMSMEKLMALSESYFAGNLNEKPLNEGAEGSDKGDVAMLNDSSYTVVHAELGMSFEKVLKVCVGFVTGTPPEGTNSGLMSALKA